MKESLLDTAVYDKPSMVAQLDGRDVVFTKITSDIFDLKWPAVNILDHGYDLAPTFIGKTLPTISDGYWLFLHPDQLTIGNHVLHVAAQDPDYFLQVIYNIKVH